MTIKGENEEKKQQDNMPRGSERVSEHARETGTKPQACNVQFQNELENKIMMYDVKGHKSPLESSGMR